jgi:hypothetical protein
MCVDANQIKKRYNIAAAVFAWLTLAGFVTLPNTFTSLQGSSFLTEKAGGRVVQTTVSNIQLLPLASVFCFVGLSGTCFLWVKFQLNYIWLISNLFL